MNMEKVQLKKVLMLRSDFPIGGVTKHIAVLSGELLNRGITIEVGSAGGEGFSLPGMDSIKKIYIRLYPSSLRNLFSSVITLFKLVKKGDVQVIHSHHRFATICAWIVSRVLPVPLVYTEHGFSHDRKLMVRLFQPDHFLTATEVAKKHMVEYLRIKPEKISVIPNGTILEDNYYERSKRESDGSARDIGVNICYAGRLSEEKGMLVLLDAWEMTAKQYPWAHLWIIGDGNMRSEMEQIVVARGLSRQTTFTGFQDDSSKFLSSMDMVVLPSLTENMSMILLEAMAMGIPVIASDVGGIPEVVKNGVEGLLVRSGDPKPLYHGIKTLLDDPELRIRMGQLGYKKVAEKYNLKQMGDAYISFYLDVIKQHSEKSRN